MTTLASLATRFHARHFEPEIGTQRQCRTCREYWPLDPEFYHRKAGKFHPDCKACRSEQRAAQYAGRREEAA
jgi:hypothetical protein